MNAIMQLSEKDQAILDREFSKEEARRDEIGYFRPIVQRGSYRISQGLIRTESEQREHIEAGLRAKLPAVKRSSWFKRLFRKVLG